MPYNSSSFEQQLAKYKQAQAEKVVGDLPRKRYEVYEDPHKIKSHVNADRGSIKSYALDPIQLMGEGAQTSPVIRPEAMITPLIITKTRKPFYKRTWFILLVVTTLPTFAMPVFFKDEWNQMMGVVSSIKTSTGVDPFSVSTYVNMFKGHATPAATPEEQADSILNPQQPAPAAAPVVVDKNDLAQPMDMHDAVQKAQEKTDSITAKGSDYSMKYIEDETNRLNDMAKQIDQQNKR